MASYLLTAQPLRRTIGEILREMDEILDRYLSATGEDRQALLVRYLQLQMETDKANHSLQEQHRSAWGAGVHSERAHEVAISPAHGV